MCMGARKHPRLSRALLQHYLDDHHSHGATLEHHSWDSRDSWRGYGSDKVNEGQGLPPTPR